MTVPGCPSPPSWQSARECTMSYWIGRTHNLQRLLPTLAAGVRVHPGFRHDPRHRSGRGPTGLSETRRRCPAASTGTADLVVQLEEELSYAGFCQRIVAVNDLDATLIRFAGYDAVSVLGHLAVPRPTPAPFRDRVGLLFVGALHSVDSPNYDGLLWFLSEVFPPGQPASGNVRHDADHRRVRRT